jgi:hypothetical protein
MDYSQRARREYTLESVAADVAAAAMEAHGRIRYFDWVPLVMEESLLECGVRMPSAEEVAAAKEFMKTFEGKKPKNVPEVYARETVLLSQMPPTRELKIQALRIGSLGIGTIPNETYGSTGLYIKKTSPLVDSFVVELANGCEGYIPPPELHPLGGYTCWRARTACLEPQAERQISDRVLELLSSVISICPLWFSKLEILEGFASCAWPDSRSRADREGLAFTTISGWENRCVTPPVWPCAHAAPGDA